MELPEELQERYPIVEFTDLAELLVVRGITAVAYVKPWWRQADKSMQWCGVEDDEDFAKSTLTDDIGLISPMYETISPIGIVSFGDNGREMGFPVDNAVSESGEHSRIALTIGDFVAKKIAVRPVDWDEVVEGDIKFSYGYESTNIPSAGQQIALELTTAERQKIFNSVRHDVDRLVAEEAKRLRRRER